MDLVDRIKHGGAEILMNRGFIEDPNLGILALYNPENNPIQRRKGITFQDDMNYDISEGTSLAKINGRYKDGSGYLLNTWEIPQHIRFGMFPRGLGVRIFPLDEESRVFRPKELEVICENTGIDKESLRKGDYALQLPGFLIADLAKEKKPLQTQMHEFLNEGGIVFLGTNYGTYTADEISQEAFEAIFPMENSCQPEPVPTKSPNLLIPRVIIGKPSK